MAELKHIQAFENFSLPVEEEVQEVQEEQVQEEDLNEGVFDGLKNKVDKYLENPKEGKADKVLKAAFAKTFASAPKVKQEILSLSHDEKVDILKKAAIKLSDPKIGVLKLAKRGGKWEVGGMPLVGHTGGGMKG